MTTLAQLDINLNLIRTSLTDGLDKARADINRFGASVNEQLEGIHRSFEMLKEAAGAFGIGLGVEQLIEFGKSALESAAQIQEAADKIGISASSLQVLQFAARETGVGVDEFTSAMERLNRRVGDAARGDKAAIEAFQRLGVGVLDAHNQFRPLLDILREVAAHIVAIKDPAAQAAAQFDIFQRSGAGMRALLIELGQHFQETQDKAMAMGQVMSDDTTKAAKDAEDTFQELGVELRNWAVNAEIATQPFFDWFRQALQDARKNAEDLSVRPAPVVAVPQVSITGTGDLANFLSFTPQYTDAAAAKAKEAADDITTLNDQIAKQKALIESDTKAFEAQKNAASGGADALREHLGRFGGLAGEMQASLEAHVASLAKAVDDDKAKLAELEAMLLRLRALAPPSAAALLHQGMAGEQILSPQPSNVALIGADTGEHNPTPTGAGESQAKRDADAYKRVVDSLRAEIAALHGDADAIKLNSSLRDAHVKLLSDQGQLIRRLIDQLEHEKAVLAQTGAEGKLKEQLGSLQAQAAALRGDTEALARNNEAVQRNATLRELHVKTLAPATQALIDQIARQQILNAEIQKGRSLLESVLTPLDKYNRAQLEINKLLADHIINQALADAGLAKARSDFEASIPIVVEFKDDVKQLGDTIGTDLADALFTSGNAAQAWRKVLTDAIKQVTTDLVHMLETAALGDGTGGGSGFLDKLLGAGFSALTGALGGGLGSTSGGAAVGTGVGGGMPIAANPGGTGGGLLSFLGLAKGGYLDAGQMAIVGENGPELFTAPSDGMVLPNHVYRGMLSPPQVPSIGGWPGGAFAGMGGGGTVNTYNTIDARGADAAAIARLETALRELHRTFEPRAVAAVDQRRKRGGVFAFNITR